VIRVLILGGTGFVGPYLVRELVELGHTVTVFHRGESETDLARGARHVHGAFGELEQHLPQLLSLEPQVVVDMRAFRREEGARSRRFAGVARRAVVLSSVDVYRAFGRLHLTEPGPPDPVPLTEDSPLREVVIQEDYDKLGVEAEALSEPAYPVTILRLPAIYGPGDRGHRLYPYVKRMDDRRPAIVLDEQFARWRWARAYVEDVAHAIALAVTEDESAGQIYNVAEPVAFSEKAWVQRVAQVHGWQGEIVERVGDRLPDSLRKTGKFDMRQNFVVDSSRIRTELGYGEVTDANEALSRTIEWERDNPPDAIDEDFDYAGEDAAL
jgi:nucleoside-diphosphate-sugar epimerase